MLRITVMNNPGSLTFHLEGRLAGPWVRELQRCWHDYQSAEHQPVVCFDLTDVTFVDAAGKAFLAARHAEGGEFVAAGCLVRAIVAEITHMPMPDCGQSEPKTTDQFVGNQHDSVFNGGLFDESH